MLNVLPLSDLPDNFLPEAQLPAAGTTSFPLSRQLAQSQALSSIRDNGPRVLRAIATRALHVVTH